MYLVFDVETTGLPPRTSCSSQKYPSPFELKSYENCRVVQITFALVNENHEIQLLQDYIIRNPLIQITNSDIHGITTERANIEGSGIDAVLAQFYQALLRCDCVVGHNLEFDMYIVASEAIRANRVDIFKQLWSKKAYCTMKTGIPICKLPSQYGGEYKYPRLSELYKTLFGTEPENCHNSKYDVIHTLRCYKYLIQK